MRGGWYTGQRLEVHSSSAFCQVGVLLGPWLLLYLLGGLLLPIFLIDTARDWIFRRSNRRRLEREGKTADDEDWAGPFQVRDSTSRTRARHLRRVKPGMDVGTRRGQGLPKWTSGDEWSPSDE
jgi:hypothetical protein